MNSITLSGGFHQHIRPGDKIFAQSAFPMTVWKIRGGVIFTDPTLLDRVTWFFCCDLADLITDLSA